MKSALECIREAERCEILAGQCKDTASRGMLLASAAQWRKLAGEAAGHKRMVELGDKPPSA